jgi:hypothetical protein
MAAMTEWIWMCAFAAAAGLGTATIVWLVDLRPRRGAARDELAHGLERADLALLTGGPAREVDADMVSFAERGLVHARDGRLETTDAVDRMLTTPMDSPAYAPRWSRSESLTLVSVRDRGREGVDAVRRGILGMFVRGRLHGLARRGLVISATRRKWEPMLVAGPTLLAMFGCSMAAIMNTRPLVESEWPAAITIMAWLPVTLATALVYSARPGFHGRDPRSRLGRDVTTLVAEVPAATQADLVARGGFAAMTDAGLRAAVQADATDSRWNIRWRAGSRSDVNAVLVAQGLDFGGGGGDGGGDGGGGGD